MISRWVRLELQERHSGLSLELLQFRAEGTGLAAVLLALVLAARCVRLLLQVLGLAVERTHGVHRLVHTVDQPFALRVGKAQVADAQRHTHYGTCQS